MFGFGKGKVKIEAKAYPAASAFVNTGQAQYSTMSYESLAKEGYKMNAVAFRCIYMIKQAAGSLDIRLMNEQDDGKGGREKVEVTNHPLLDVLRKPNPMQSRADFIAEMVAYYLIAGNTYAFNPNDGQAPKRLYPLRPNTVIPISGKQLPTAFKLDNGVSYPVDQITGKSDVCQIKDFDPLSDWLGQSRLQASAVSVDTFNASQKWNYNLLKNSAKPSGVLNMKDDGGGMTTEQFNEYKEMILNSWVSSEGAGRPQILANLEWTQTSLTPMDMDFQNSQLMAARYIANVFGVPSQLLNIPESQTFSNYEQAQLSFWQDTVIPITNVVYGGLARWLFQFYPDTENFSIEVNLDKVSALDPIRREKAERLALLASSGVLTINEAREQLGSPAIDGGDELFISGTQVPLSAIHDITDEGE